MKKILITLFVFIFYLQIIAQRQYFFIEVESQDSTVYDAKFGKFSVDNDKDIVKNKSVHLEESQALQEITTILDNAVEKNKNIFIYIHGMWGHQAWYQKDVLNTFENEIFTGSENPAVVISFIWHSGINYWDNVHHALAVGKYFSPFFQKIINIPESNSKVLCHSMGNRVFQGIYTQINTDSCLSPPLDELFMVAADLEANIFEDNQPLMNINKMAKTVTVYVHNNDRSLGMSRSLNDNKRLGIDGNKSICLQDSCLQIVDVSIINDNEGFGPALSNHRYFYTSPTVRNDLKLSMAGLPNSDRTKLDHSRRLQLKQLKDH
jgi:esterase/lipase superfamily enzyme